MKEPKVSTHKIKSIPRGKRSGFWNHKIKDAFPKPKKVGLLK